MRRRSVAMVTLVAGASAAAVALADTGATPAGGTAHWVYGAVGSSDEPAAPIRVTEGAGGVRIVVRHLPDAPERLAWTTRDGTATAGEDFEAASGIVQFRPGEREREIEVPVRADGLPEGAERFEVVLDAFPGLPGTAAGAIATVVITDP